MPEKRGKSGATRESPVDALEREAARHLGLDWTHLFLARTWELSGLATIHYNRATARAVTGDLSGADADFTKVIDLHKDCHLLYEERGLVRLRQGREKEAEEDLIVFLKGSPDSRLELEAKIKAIQVKK